MISMKEYLNLRSKMILIFQMFISVKVSTLNWYLKQMFYLHGIDMQITTFNLTLLLKFHMPKIISEVQLTKYFAIHWWMFKKQNK